jgi:predicted nucleic acid-binding protein
MTIVDTSVWIDHFRGGATRDGLSTLLRRDQVFVHPCVIGELALGHLGPRRALVMADLEQLPAALQPLHEDVLMLIEVNKLHGSGIGWSDAQLLASAKIERAELWTLDKNLHRVAKRLGVAR